MIHVDIKGDLVLLGRLREIPGGIDQAFRLTADEMFSFVRRRVDSHTKSGALLDSLSLRKDGDDYLIDHDASRAPYAAFVHWGTRPHTIKPRTRKALRWASGGKFFFAKAVRHPGYKGDAWMEDVAREAPAIFDRHVRKLLEKR